MLGRMLNSHLLFNSGLFLKLKVVANSKFLLNNLNAEKQTNAFVSLLIKSVLVSLSFGGCIF